MRGTAIVFFIFRRLLLKAFKHRQPVLISTCRFTELDDRLLIQLLVARSKYSPFQCCCCFVQLVVLLYKRGHLEAWCNLSVRSVLPREQAPNQSLWTDQFLCIGSKPMSKRRPSRKVAYLLLTTLVASIFAPFSRQKVYFLYIVTFCLFVSN